MSSSLLGRAAMVFVLGGLPNAAHAGSFDANFTCKPDLGRALFASTVPAISYTFGNGSLAVNGQSNASDAGGYFTTTFATAGDFTASVTVSRPNLGNAFVGFVVGDIYANALQDIFYSANDQIGSNVWDLTDGNVLYGTDIGDTSTTATFTISRTGNVITSGYNEGAGFVALETSPNQAGYGVPVRVTLFLVGAVGSTDAHAGSFATFALSAGSLGKTCKSPGL